MCRPKGCQPSRVKEKRVRLFVIFGTGNSSIRHPNPARPTPMSRGLSTSHLRTTALDRHRRPSTWTHMINWHLRN